MEYLPEWSVLSTSDSHLSVYTEDHQLYYAHKDNDQAVMMNPNLHYLAGLNEKPPAPERGTSYWLQLDMKGRVLLIEVYEIVGESVISVCKKAQKG